MIRRPPRSTRVRSSAASDVYKRQLYRYSCQHSHFRYLQQGFPLAFTGLRNALLPHAQSPQHALTYDSTLRVALASAHGDLSPLNFARRSLASSKLVRSNILRWIARIRGFGYWLTAPLHLPRRTTRPVSYYAFFKGWLLLSQPPGCLSLPTSFAT